MAEDKDKDKTSKSDINFEYNQGVTGLNMDNIPSQIKSGSLSYALNAALENFDSNSVTYQNEPGTEFCLNLPSNYLVIGKYLIPEQQKQIFFLSNPSTGDSEIGHMTNNDCVYHKIINAKCLNFDVNHPIHKVVHKTGNCGTEIYWAQTNADRRFLNLDKIPMVSTEGSTPCDESLTDDLDCNQIRVQPVYSVPQLYVKDVIIGGNLIAGVYQFAFQYADALGNPLSNYFSVTNPTPIADPQFATANFNYPVGKAIVLNIGNIETGGQFEFFNIAVIKTINAITSVELVGTYGIEGTSREITYSGQNVTQIRLTINDIFESFPFYGPADDVTTAQDVLIWKGLSAPERVNYQKIANQILLLWETWRIPADQNYADELNATNLRGYLRDEVYPFEIVFILSNGMQTDAFHIPGKEMSTGEAALGMIDPSNNDYIEDPAEGPVEYWRIYNTAQNLGFSPDYTGAGNPDYRGPYQIGTFSYWRSEDTYPCDEAMWGDLASQPIRHHKFPDVEVSPIVECKSHTPGAKLTMGNVAIFPIGVRVDTTQIGLLIESSDLTLEQKADIVGYKIVRGDRTDNKSIVGKGILRNVGIYERDDQKLYYPNYPYNDLNADPFINSANNAYQQISEPWLVVTTVSGNLQFQDPNTNKPKKIPIVAGTTIEICSVTRPIYMDGAKATIGPSNYDVYFVGLIPPGGLYSQGFELKWTDPFSSDNTSSTLRTNNMNYHIKVAGIGDDDDVAWIRVAVGVVPDTGGCHTTLFGASCKAEVVQEDNPKQPEGVIDFDGGDLRNPRIGRRTSKNCKGDTPIVPITSNEDLAHRQIFNSPETSFGQPFLGDVLKLESVIFGAGEAHFVEVKDNAKYRLLTKEAQQDALASSLDTANGDPAAFFAAYQAYLQIYINGITRKNYAYSFNSIADYNYCVAVPDGQEVKQRRLDLKKYLIPAIQNVGEEFDINNYQRETSVYLRTELDVDPLPFPHLSPNMVVTGVKDVSRFTVGCSNTSPCGTSTTTSTTTLYPAYCPGSCAEPAKKQPISVVSYYASLKNTFRGQWGQMYSYQTIDTGFMVDLKSKEEQPKTVFGGDTFICRFAFKTKLPFFIDNRVGAPDDSEIFYDELGNIGYPKFWHSARSILESYEAAGLGTLTNIISYKAHNFDCPNCQDVAKSDPNRTFYDGYFYLFAYGIPNFYVESSYNIDLRQAFNNKEGDFWPHVSNSIPDDWVQESFVSIANDNTYNYNTTFSKQNKETFYSHIPPNFQFKECEFIYPFRAIFSDPQIATADTTVNNWLTYRATSYYDFPQNYGKLVSLDGIDNRQVLARFENKSMLYNAMYTAQTNMGGQVYLGQSLFDRRSPPYDYGETDLGYVGSQHKFLLKIPEGQVSIDAKRGQVFLLGPQQAKDLSAPGSGMNRFFTDHLAFEISRFFPDVNVDNNFTSVGLHGVYDSKYDRIIITKLDYIPLSTNIKFDSDLQEFYKETPMGDSSFRTKVFLSDTDSFCNKSWTLSFNFITNSWISFHSYLPNWYIGGNNFFYSGKKGCCSEFDFAFIVGELVDNPATTSSTTSTTSSTSSTTTTTTTKACVLEGGTVETMLCNLAGTAVILEPTPPPPCTRPVEVLAFVMYSGYTIVTPPLQVLTSDTLLNACTAKQFVFANEGNVIPTQIIFWGINKNPGTKLYADNFSSDCVPAAAGFYYTTNLLDGIFEINALGEIVAIHPCTVATTTTTTTCSLYLYDVQFYLCGTCTPTGPGTIGNSEFLTEGKYYFDSVTGFKMLADCYKGCGTGTDRNIPASSAQDNCPGVVCPASGAFYRYTIDIANCTSCPTLFVLGDILSAAPLVVGKWYYNAANHIRYNIKTFVGMDPGPANAILTMQSDSCAALVCPSTTTSSTTV